MLNTEVRWICNKKLSIKNLYDKVTAIKPAGKAYLECHLVAFYIKATYNQKQWTNSSGTLLNSSATPNIVAVMESIQRQIQYPCCPQERHNLRDFWGMNQRTKWQGHPYNSGTFLFHR